MSAGSDIVVVGGGINGVSTAFHLAKAGASVTLLEKTFIAGGPTGLSSAIIRQHYSNGITARMALDSLRVWQNFAEMVGGEAGYTKVGFLIAVKPEDIEGLQANIALQQSVGIDTRFVSPQEMKQIEPQLDIAGLGGAAYEPDGGYCDPAMAANSYADAAKSLGADIRTGITATQIMVGNGRIQGVETTDGFFPAEKVVVAAGPWSMNLLETLGIALPIITARIKIGLFKRPPEFSTHPVWADFVSQIYARPETGDMMLVGSISPDEADDQVSDADNFNEKADLDIIAEFAEGATRRFPVMSQAHLAGNYASLYDITPDWHPILDAVPDNEGLFICAGGSGHSFKLAPATGAMMANMVLEDKQPDDDINLFSFDRFAAGKEVRGKYEYSIVG